MTYYARSANQAGEKETIAHHLQRTADLCRLFCATLGDASIGEWMGFFHDFGKYSDRFQDVLAGRAQHIDHALPGAALLYGKICRNGNNTALGLLPLALAVRAHHSALTNFDTGELDAWLTAHTDGKSPDGQCYAIPSAKDPACQIALQAFIKENKNALPTYRPFPTDLPPLRQVGFLEWMLYTRLLYSALTDADYSASAEHFSPNYLTQTSAPPLDVTAAWESLEHYRQTLRQQAAASCDPAIVVLRDRLFQLCQAAGATAVPGTYTLTAPTGAGKTLAMLAFGLQQILHGRRRMIFVLPFISIIEQNAAIYRKIIPQLLEDHSQMAPKDEQAARDLAQRWDAPCIVTTSVKFFEGLFSCRGPDCRRLHQIAGSVILFDEAQSLPVTLAGATLRTLQALCRYWGCTVVFSTATQPAFDVLPDSTWTPRELVPDVQSLFNAARRVDCHWQMEPISFSEIAYQAVQTPNACVIVNLRRHAHNVYTALQQLCPPDSVFLLSTDLCPAHRTAVLTEIRYRLQAGLPCYLAATQCIEAGVDISFVSMFRALAPLEGIIQAAGRCNRHDARCRGKLTVFVPQTEDPAQDQRLYPEDFYRQGANAVRTLLARHPIDLDDLSHIREYYTILYQDGQLHDKPDLTHAIEIGDFQETQRQYQLIQQTGVPVIVPYLEEQALYDRLCQAAADGITGDWLRQAAPLMVNCFDKKLVFDCCEQLHTPARYGIPPTPAGCYLLRDSKQYDSQRTGLHLDALTEQIY